MISMIASIMARRSSCCVAPISDLQRTDRPLFVAQGKQILSFDRTGWSAAQNSSQQSQLRSIAFTEERVDKLKRFEEWLGGRDSNPDSQIQSLESYHWTTSQQEMSNLRRQPLFVK
jgi:hypothetical protein